MTEYNLDGSWRLVLCIKSSAGGGEEEARGTDLVYLDLFPDGRHNENSTLWPTDHAMFFPLLPANRQQTRDGWSQTWGCGVDTMYYSLTEAPSVSPPTVTIGVRQGGPICDLMGATGREVVLFDTARGLPYRRVGEYRGSPDWQGVGTAVCELEFVGELPPETLSRFKQDADAFFAASSISTRLSRRAAGEHEATRALYSQAESTLLAARDRIQDTLVLAVLDAKIRELRGDDWPEHRHVCTDHSLIGKAAPGWTLTDIDGARHSLADNRGRVVLLLFWSRGRRECLRALALFAQVAEQLDDRDVVQLAVITSDDDHYARTVAARMGLRFPLAADLDLANRFCAFPTPVLYVIDGEGLIREVVRGITRHHVDHIAAAVNALLRK